MVRQIIPFVFVRSHESEHGGQLDIIVLSPSCFLSVGWWLMSMAVANGKSWAWPAEEWPGRPKSRPLARTTTAGRIWLSQADSAFPIELRKPAHLCQMCELCWSLACVLMYTCCLWWVKLWTHNTSGLCPAYLHTLSISFFVSKKKKLLISFYYLFLWLSAYWDFPSLHVHHMIEQEAW